VRPVVNIDLAELPDEPEALYAATDLANLACGGHAGDAGILARALELCRRHGVAVGAHPSYPDREGFGRRRLVMSPADIFASVRAQCALLAAEATHLKPHGALYHAADEDDALATAVVDAARAALPRLARVLGPPAGALARAAARAGLAFLREGFADRAVDPATGRLVPRDRPGAVIGDAAAAVERAAALAAQVDTLCVHGDTPGAVAIARAVRAYLAATFSPTGQETPVPPRPQ
jgi:UPF0271 protein